MNAAEIAAGAVSPVEAVQDALSASRRSASSTRHHALRRRGARAGPGGVSGRLAGVPLLVKDLFDTAGLRTTYASSLYAEHVPERTAPSWPRSRRRARSSSARPTPTSSPGASCGQNTFYGDPINPTAPDRIAGGSSSGNAVALAAGMVPLTLGTDTGGSVRMPAGACGIVGLKTPIGAVSVEGVFPLVPSFDTVGPMARTVADCALAYSVLTGTPVPEPGMRGLRVGLLTAVPDLAPVASAGPRDERALAHAERLRALGADVQEAVLPMPEGDTWAVFNAEAARSHAATFPSRRDEYGPTIRAKLDGALLVSDDDYQAGLAALHAWRAQAAREPGVDLLVSPTLGVEELPPAGVDELDVRLAVSAYTRPFSYLGWPAIAIGGLQIAGRDVATVIAAALALEYQGNW